MKDTVGSAYVELLIDGKKFRGQIIDEVRGSGKATGTEFSKALNGAITLASVTAAGTAIYNIGKQILGVASQVQQAKIAFDQMTGSATASVKLLKDIQSFAANTPFSQMGLIDGAKRLLAYGFNAQQIIPIMNSLGNAVAAVGGTNAQETLNGVIVALGQVQTKGRLMQQEMNQMAERGIPVFDILRKKLGLTQEELGKLGEQGISAAQAIPAILEGLNERFPAMMEKQARTIEGRLSNLLDITKIIMGNMGLSVADGFGNMISDLSNALTENQYMLTQFGSDIGGMFLDIVDGAKTASLGVSEVLGLLLESVGVLVQEIDNNISDMYGNIQDQSSATTDALTGDISDISYIFRLGITGIIATFKILGSGFAGVVDFMINGSKVGSEYMSNAFSYARESIKGGAASVGGTVVNYFVDMFNKASSKINDFTSLVNKALPNSLQIGKVGTLSGVTVDTSGIKKAEIAFKTSGKSLSETFKSSFSDVGKEVDALETKRGDIHAQKLESISKKQQSITEKANLDRVKNEFDSYQKRTKAGEKFSKSEIDRMNRYSDYIKKNTVNTSLNGLFGDYKGSLGGNSKGSGSKKGSSTEQEAKKELEVQKKLIDDKAKLDIESIKKSQLTALEKANRIKSIVAQSEIDKQILEGKTTELSEKNADRIIKRNEEIKKKHEETTKKLQKYGEEITKIGEKFSDMKDGVVKDSQSINDAITTAGKKLETDLGNRYVEVGKQIEELKKTQSESQTGLDTEQQKTLNDLEKERLYIITQTSESTREQAMSYDALSESAKKVFDSQKEIAILTEKKNIADAFTSQGSLLENKLKIDPATNEAFYTNEKGELVAITDLKNIEYARDLANKQIAIQEELRLKELEVVNFIDQESRLYSKKKELLTIFSDDVQRETDKQKINLESLISMFSKAAQAQREYLALQGSVGASGKGRAHGGTIVPNMIYRFQENGMEYIQSPAYARVQPAPASSYKTQNITVNNQNYMKGFNSGDDYGNWLKQNIGNYL